MPTTSLAHHTPASAPSRDPRRRVLVIAALVLSPAMLGAQRDVQRHEFDSPEGRLLGFYSAALAFTSGGPPASARPWGIDIGVEATYLPPLSREQRTAGSDKPQSSNLAPAFPRPRISIVLPGSLHFQASWIPPLRVFDAKANLFSAGISRRMAGAAGFDITPRLAFTTGRIEGAITCNGELSSGSQDQRVYYSAICFGRESEDHFEPTHLTGEVMASQTTAGGRFVPYGSLGVRHERTRFDIGVIRDDGTREQDHPILTMRTTRPFATGGVQWRPHHRFTTGAEVYYAPGSLLTARVLGTLHVRQR